MSFTPVIPTGGFSGWRFLSRTLDAQKAAFGRDAALKRDEDYFRQKIGSVVTAEALVSDRRLMSVALTAYGLEGDINSKAFIRKILEDGTLGPDALGNRLADKRYLEFSKAFGFGDFAVPNTQLSTFADKILHAYEERKFEAAVGEQDNGMRLGLNADRELAALAGRALSTDGKWFTALGSPPLREVLQTGLGLPRSFTSVNLDQQLTILKERAEKLFGSDDLAQFSDPEKREKLVRLYLVRAEIQSNTITSGTAALTLLSQSQNRLSRYV
ncbi:MAG: DUF1217 domain-containing protein [Paracoccaceae bacterium]